MDLGEEMMIWCRGGRSMLKRQTFPPAVEIPEPGGMYVLHDDGHPSTWVYVYVEDNQNTPAQRTSHR